MRNAIIADIHSNLEALEAVLTRIESVDTIYCLGDVVGYGPDPVACIELLKRYKAAGGNLPFLFNLRGNHDDVVLQMLTADYDPFRDFNDFAAVAIKWTYEQLKNNLAAMDFLKQLKLFHREDENCFAHTVYLIPELYPPLRDRITGKTLPIDWSYVRKISDAEEFFDKNHNLLGVKLSFIGHTHVPNIFRCEMVDGKPVVSEQSFEFGRPLDLDPGKSGHERYYLINVGSVGQPRDKDPRACYAVLDNDQLTLFRVSYDVRKTQEKMKAAGLPLILIERLAKGE